jgi:hypothetical protein
MLILSTIGLAVIYIFGMEEIASRTEISASRALYLADGGIDLTKGWLVNYQGFPEWVNKDRNPFKPFTPLAVTYTDEGTTVNGTIDVLLTPKRAPPAGDDNQAGNITLSNPRGTGERYGYYFISSSGILTMGSTPGQISKTIKNITATIYMSTVTPTAQNPNGLVYRVINNSWNEKPLKRTIE